MARAGTPTQTGSRRNSRLRGTPDQALASTQLGHAMPVFKAAADDFTPYVDAAFTDFHTAYDRVPSASEASQPAA
ncbi:hypothetical protein GCM10025876_39720 [Demequina litorisediminis]|uniref:Uncharacterized protein n=1 Tax=Demequina litorisediminis TaxID=1849022 RepID=A0ABQ6IKT3_9MICO|nr:hypothetical protein GCM10025876_39720 [Demequina litorisediminis]